MIIDRNSWHYRWFAERWDHRPRSLCWYFWKVVISILAGVAYVILCTMLAALVTFILSVPFSQWFLNDIPIGLSVISFLMWFGIGVAANRIYRNYLYDTGQLKRKEKVYKEPSLITAYLDAKHRKICPLLEYKYVESE